MKTATGILRHEHDAILGMLEVVEALARQLSYGKEVPGRHLSDVLDFFTTFADRCHHGKEEGLLFPLLEKKGLPRDGGPIAVMLHEHDVGRRHVEEMAAAAQAYAGGDPAAGVRWAQAAVQYAELLRLHIHKENNVLFPWAERTLTGAEQERLATDFDRVETEKIGAGTHEKLHAMIERLSAEVLGK